QGYAPQQPPPQQTYAPQQAAPQGYAPQQAPPQGYAPQQAPPQQTYAPQQAAPQGYAPQQAPPQQTYAPQQAAPQGYAPQQAPPQGYAPQQAPPQQTYAPVYAPPAAAGAAAGAAVGAQGPQGPAGASQQTPAPAAQAAPPPPAYAPPPPAYAPPAGAGAAAGAAVAAPGAAPQGVGQQSAPAAGAAGAAALGAGTTAPAPTVQDVPSAGPRLPPGAVPVPQSAAPAPAPTRSGEADIGSAPPPPVPPGHASSVQKSAPVDDRLIRLEWRPAHVEGSRGWGPMVQVPVMGPEKRPLKGRSLYTALDRNDLAEEYERRLAAKRIMGTGSALLLISGIAVGISAFAIHGCNPGDVKCWNDRDAQLRERFYWSGGLVLGGAVLGIASSAYSAHPVSRDELVGLIRQHNDQIRSQAGVRVGAMALPGGGGLSLAGAF
ncbi:MAG TPA: hypothetical protein VLT82_09170, partial [Myxococcaceae bacterium]|nr:hypothetical protein [Myxococcaceae bacterium]